MSLLTCWSALRSNASKSVAAGPEVLRSQVGQRMHSGRDTNEICTYRVDRSPDFDRSSKSESTARSGVLSSNVSGCCAKRVASSESPGLPNRRRMSSMALAEGSFLLATKADLSARDVSEQFAFNGRYASKTHSKCARQSRMVACRAETTDVSASRVATSAVINCGRRRQRSYPTLFGLLRDVPMEHQAKLRVHGEPLGRG